MAGSLLCPPALEVYDEQVNPEYTWPCSACASLRIIFRAYAGPAHIPSKATVTRSSCCCVSLPAQRRAPVSDLDLRDLGPQEVLDFLQHLEAERHSVPATRNVRLAAIHAFFRYCAAEHPDHLELCQRVLAVPFKRARSRPVEYLEFDEIQAVLTAIDRTPLDGRRDYALLATMFNTGARVQEIVSLRVARCAAPDKPPHVRLFGKGRKERVCPLWPQTAEILSALLAERGGEPPSQRSSLP